MFRSFALATAAALTLAACGSDSETTAPGQDPAAPFSLSVASTNISRAGTLEVTLRNETGRSVESGTFCVDGGFEQRVGESWVAVTRESPRFCTLPALLWSPGLARTETVSMAEWTSNFSGSGPWTVRATYRVLDGNETVILRSAPITVTQ